MCVCVDVFWYICVHGLIKDIFSLHRFRTIYSVYYLSSLNKREMGWKYGHALMMFT